MAGVLRLTAFSFVALGLLQTRLSADAIIEYAYEYDCDPAPEVICLPEPGEYELSIRILVDQTTLLQGARFGFDGIVARDVLEFPGFTLSNFAWNPGLFGNQNIWFFDNTLPEPVVATLLGGLSVPDDGLLLATFKIEFQNPGDGYVSTGPELWDDNSSWIPFEGDSIQLRLAPEPAALSLLAFGGVIVMRRRR